MSNWRCWQLAGCGACPHVLFPSKGGCVSSWRPDPDRHFLCRRGIFTAADFYGGPFLPRAAPSLNTQAIGRVVCSTGPWQTGVSTVAVQPQAGALVSRPVFKFLRHISHPSKICRHYTVNSVIMQNFITQKKSPQSGREGNALRGSLILVRFGLYPWPILRQMTDLYTMLA